MEKSPKNVCKIAFFSVHPAPYRDPFLTVLARRGNIDLHVFQFQEIDYGHDFWNIPLPQYSVRVLKEYAQSGCLKSLHLSGFGVILQNFDYFIFPGFMHLTSIVGMFLCRLLRKKYIISADSVADGSVCFLKRKIKTSLIKRACFLFVPGTASMQYFSSRFNFPENKICTGAYALDTDRVTTALENYRINKREIRAKYGLVDSDRVFLMVANMTKNRCYPVLAKAFTSINEEDKTIRFVMIGKGEDSELITQMCKRNPCMICVPGCTFEEMIKLFAVADIYVHGGCEPASTALVIGAMAGLPLLSSYAVGLARDVLINGETGIAVEDYQAVDSWCDGIRKLYSFQSEWEKMGGEAKRMARMFDSAIAADRFCSFLKKCGFVENMGE